MNGHYNTDQLWLFNEDGQSPVAVAAGSLPEALEIWRDWTDAGFRDPYTVRSGGYVLRRVEAS